MRTLDGDVTPKRTLAEEPNLALRDGDIAISLALGVDDPFAAVTPGERVTIDLLSEAPPPERLRLLLRFWDADGHAVEQHVRPIDGTRPLRRFRVPEAAAVATLGLVCSGFGQDEVILGIDVGERGPRALDTALADRDAGAAALALEALRRVTPHLPGVERAPIRVAELAGDHLGAAEGWAALEARGDLAVGERHRLIAARRRAGQHDLADADVERWGADAAQDLDLLDEHARVAEDARRWPHAMDRWARLIAADARRAASVAGRLIESTGRDDAEAALVRALADDPASPVRAVLAELLMRSDRAEEAAGAFRELAVQRPEEAERWSARARAAQRRVGEGDADGAPGPRPRVTIDQAVTDDGYYDIAFEDIVVPVRLRRTPGAKALVILFHGAMDRETRAWPHFAGLLPDLPPAHQVSITDTTLLADPQLAAGWYLGTQTAPLQDILPRLIARLAEALGAERRVYVGGSSGGFAALFYAWSDPGSVAVAANPQTDLRHYIASSTEALRTKAWPDAMDFPSLAEKVALHIGSLYARSNHSLVIYVQSRGDRRHMTTQFPAFLRGLRGQGDGPILDIGYWGIPRHSGSAPASAYLPWVRAALLAKAVDAGEINDIHYRLTSGGAARPAVTGARSEHAAADISLADAIAAAMLDDQERPE